jgi:L,D-transpeptidase YbiS
MIEAAEQPVPRRALVLAIPGGRRARLTLAVAAFLAAVAGVLAYGTGFSYRPASGMAMVRPEVPSGEGAALERSVARLRSQKKSLEGALRQKSPRGTFIIIDQTHNRLYLKKDDTILLEAKCSAGSGMVLKEEGGKNRKWVFDTPRGQFKVLNRIEDPAWKKPDWAFIEEGEPIPKNPGDRIEYGTLGEYALYFGDGYMIHGTLYERLLGRNVSHGCIRVGREDLRKVWASAPIGTPIYIY